MTDELESLRRQLANAEKHLRDIHERKSEYPLRQDIPLLLLQNEREKAAELARLQGDIARLEAEERRRQAADYSAQGWEHFSREDFNRAIAAYTKAIELDPNFAAAYTVRAMTYTNQDKYNLAMTDVTKAIELGFTNAATYSIRGRIYRLQGTYDLAIADLTRAIELDPDYEWAHYERAKACIQQAIADYEHGLQIATDQGLRKYAEAALQALRQIPLD